jgi:glycosyltransferase involved in cell wall biosynthesis
MSPLKIAMIGLRGLPATWGGVERHVEELGARLADRGHEVTVFTRPAYSDRRGDYRGMTLKPLPTVTRKHLEATVHSAVAAAATVGRGFDVVHFHAIGPGLFTPIPSLMSRARVVQTIHGLDDQRDKWGGTAQKVLGIARCMSARVPDEVVVVSEELGRVYRAEHGRETHHIPNGAPHVTAMPAGEVLARLGVTPQRYLVSLGRLVPEKDPETLIRAFAKVDTDARLVIVGGSSHTNEYVALLRRLADADDRVVLAGFVYGDELTELMSSAGLFVQPSRLEGLPLTLLEAAAFERPVVVSDIPPHLEVVGGVNEFGCRVVPVGDVDALAEAIRLELADPEDSLAGGRRLGAQVLRRYDWDRATDQLVEVYRRAVAGPGRRLCARSPSSDLRI